MRLINTRTLALAEFFGDEIPRYAIVSHTWGHDEVTFQDWKEDLCVAREREGFRKIDMARIQAIDDGLDYLWIDTCCINKESSAELSEAINFMFAWYECAVRCYAYLSDVDHAERLDGPAGDAEHSFDILSRSLWFTRGWTLQELLAPREVLFFARGWSLLGTRKLLAGVIQRITNIDWKYLQPRSRKRLSDASVAERMSWLSCRKTTREEDMAYCMLGIFDINMPLLYGEGAKAFARLQEEILKTSTDQSLFCWSWTESDPGSWVSMLAPSPRNFRNGQDYHPAHDPSSRPVPYSMTNFGLSIQLMLVRPANIRISNFGFRPPECIGILSASTKGGHLIGVPLESTGLVDTYRVVRDFPRPISLRWNTRDLGLLKSGSLKVEVHDIFVPSKAPGSDLGIVQLKPHDSSFHLGEYAIMLLVMHSRGSGVEIFTRIEAIPRYTDSMAGFITMKKFKFPPSSTTTTTTTTATTGLDSAPNSAVFNAVEAHGALVRLHANSLSRKDGALWMLFGVLVNKAGQSWWIFRYLDGLASTSASSASSSSSSSSSSMTEANLERLLRDAATNWQPSYRAKAYVSPQSVESRRVTKRDAITITFGPEFRAEVNDRKTVAKAAHLTVSGVTAGLKTSETI